MQKFVYMLNGGLDMTLLYRLWAQRPTQDIYTMTEVQNHRSKQYERHDVDDNCRLIRSRTAAPKLFHTQRVGENEQDSVQD